MGEGIAGRWEVAEDGYEEQIIIPKEKRDLAAEEGISTENKQKVTVQIMNLKTGESYIGRLAITGNRQTRLPLRGHPPAKHSHLATESIAGRQSEVNRAQAGRFIYQQKYKRC